MIKAFKRTALILLAVFVFPVLVSLAVWHSDQTRPQSWNEADWSSASLLPSASPNDASVIYVLAARTGRWKGAFSVHSWIVTHRQGESGYKRYDKVGWGTPVRINAYPADARWYSNPPEIVKKITGDKADRLIPKIETAIADYPHSARGGYNIWPGPNSNSFVAHVLNEVPEFGLVLPANAVGRDYPAGGKWLRIDPDFTNIQFNLNGYMGFALGARSGIELQFLGLATGFDFTRFGIKLPGFGTVVLI